MEKMQTHIAHSQLDLIVIVLNERTGSDTGPINTFKQKGQVSLTLLVLIKLLHWMPDP
jgi:hypothetical protein